MANYNTPRLYDQTSELAGPLCVAGPNGRLAVYLSKVEHTQGAPGPRTGARREGEAESRHH